MVGTNSIHPLKALPIGSPNRMRWLGIRPRSGLWQRKDGYRGRKVKKPPPTIDTTPHAEYIKGAGTDNSPASVMYCTVSLEISTLYTDCTVPHFTDLVCAQIRGWKGSTVLLDTPSQGKRGRIAAHKRLVEKDNGEFTW